MRRPRSGPGDEIDRSLQVQAGIAVEFNFFQSLQQHCAPREGYPLEGLFVEEVSSNYTDYKSRKTLGGTAVLSRLLLPEGHELPINPPVAMTYGSVPEKAKPHKAQPVVVARKSDTVTEVGIGWEIRTAQFNPQEVRGTWKWVHDFRADRAVALVALTLHSVWDTDEESLVLSARQYIDPASSPLATVTCEVPASEIPEDEQKDLLQAFHDGAWESISEGC